ncbi:unnamed protein product [Anisakis simplex]|uniref:Uncharacterized protein n=1 Tax=Anisakis simplex TaxID=6269 RepID=A0A0M3J7K5_ANISI|nr:unnamed protein product [Anisakis simplex]
MSQSIADGGMYRSQLPALSLSISADHQKSSRKQLEEMTRKAQRHCSLPPVPEVITPSSTDNNHENETANDKNEMITSKLFQQFSNRHLREQCMPQLYPAQHMKQPVSASRMTASVSHSRQVSVEDTESSTVPTVPSSSFAPTSATVASNATDSSSIPSSTSGMTVQFAAVCKLVHTEQNAYLSIRLILVRFIV